MPNLTRIYNPRLEEVLAGTAELAQTEENYWETLIEHLFTSSVRAEPFGFVLKKDALGDLHLAVQRRLIRRTIAAAKGSVRGIDRSHIEDVLRIFQSLHGHDRVSLPGLDVLRSFDQILFARPETLKQPRDFHLQVEIGVPVSLPFEAGTIRLSLERKSAGNYVTVENKKYCDGEEAFLDSSAVRSAVLTGNLVVRNWQPGDKLHRLGRASAERVKFFFQEHRVVLWYRRHWPVILLNGQIAWVRGFGVDERFAAPIQGCERVRICFQSQE